MPHQSSMFQHFNVMCCQSWVFQEPWLAPLFLEADAGVVTPGQWTSEILGSSSRLWWGPGYTFSHLSFSGKALCHVKELWSNGNIWRVAMWKRDLGLFCMVPEDRTRTKDGHCCRELDLDSMERWNVRKISLLIDLILLLMEQTTLFALFNSFNNSWDKYFYWLGNWHSERVSS